ncbi:TRAP transporter large permease [Nesterenkonia sp. LB17]|uniref:TRAP transporter large permease n=1 Tax=Nesterenkonia sp. LB17 TaxID=2901230 RepID=UPI001F4CE52B|nr:TRAP transporter large permease [Nesterenkonia sp. LB17]MCH8565265.1 TRAP transporter large permease [Nesterenkonia sp. LB17]
MLVLIFLAVPVAIAISVPSVLGIYVVSGTASAVSVLSSAPFNTVASWTYSVIPAFIFMGMLMVESGLTTKIYRATERWFGWLPGGAGVGTTAAGAGLASVSGSTIGMTYALARAAIPELLRAGFNKKMAVGTVIVAGIPGSVIPPSILLVVYAGIATVPVGQQLVAGVIPGVLIAVAFGALILSIGFFKPALVGKSAGDKKFTSEYSWGDRFSSLLPIWGFPAVMLVLFGGLFSGAFTPTEAGAAAALMALVVAVVTNIQSGAIQRVGRAALKTVSASAAIFFIIIGAELLTRLLSITGLSRLVTSWIVGFDLNPITFLLALMVMYLLMGMFFDTLSMMVLTVPILVPILTQMDISLIWFGIFMVLLGELAMVTPPVGILSFIIHGIAKDPEVNLGHNITLGDIFTSLAWFLPVAVAFIVFLIFVPELVEWLPALVG